MSLRESCYELLQKVPKGKVTTYKILAQKLGTKAYRLIGQFMKNNPHVIEWPCHRVVRSDGSLGGYAYGLPKKIELLEEEGVRVKDNKVIDFKSKTFWFN